MNDPGNEHEFREKLTQEGFEFFEHQHAFWRAKKDKNTVIFYKNGTLQFQGGDFLSYVTLLLGEEAAKPIAEESGGKGGIAISADELKALGMVLESPEEFSAKKEAALEAKVVSPVLGFDESGKGDYFGPLVFAGAIVPEELEPELLKLGVSDSKKISDSKIKSLFALIKDKIEWQVRVLEPIIYNSLYEEWGNLNLLLVEQYREFLKDFPNAKYNSIILDRFSSSDRQNKMISAGVNTSFIIEPQAERYTAVAAASVIARYHFIDWLERTSDRQGRKFPLGAGESAKGLYKELFEILPSHELRALAKVHFRI